MITKEVFIAWHRAVLWMTQQKWRSLLWDWAFFAKLWLKNMVED